MSHSDGTAGKRFGGNTSGFGSLLYAVMAAGTVLLAGCAHPAPPQETPAAYFQGAVRAGGMSRDMPGQLGDVSSAGPGSESVASGAMGPVPKFQVVARRINDRADKFVTYYAVIEPVNPGAEAFKTAVKQVLLALAADNGGPAFSASIWDHLPAAQTEVSYRSNPDLFSTQMLKAREAFNSRHLVANYVGGLSTSDEPPSYVLFWFPDAGEETPQVDQWVSAEMWKP